LGDGTTTNRWTPVEVTGMAGANGVAAGAVHSVAVRADRLVWGWGYNGYGRLGDGTITTRHTPVWTRIGNKYYYLGGQRLAMRRYGVLYWLAGDHLGTTSVVLNAAGNAAVAESRHFPYGGVRWSEEEVPTDYRWTGQRLSTELGLYQMGVRWVDPSLGRWISPDTIVPDPSNPQSLNRYSYVNNRPLVAIDTGGHCLFLITAAAGFIAGGIVSAGAQVIKGMTEGL